VEEGIFKNRLDTHLSGMTPAVLILPRGGLGGLQGYVPALVGSQLWGVWEEGMGWVGVA